MPGSHLKARLRRRDGVLLVALGAALLILWIAARWLVPGLELGVVTIAGTLATVAFVFVVFRHVESYHHEAWAERRVHYRQLEAYVSLVSGLDFPGPLPAMRDWVLSPDLALELVERIERHRPETVVELGSGVSTLVLARALQRVGRGRVLSLDHEAAFAERTRERLRRFGLDGVAEVVHAPIVEQAVDGETWPWYDLSDVPLPASIDLLLVDGPPGWLRARARYPALPALEGRLAAGALVVLDDADRPDERAVVAAWTASRPDVAVETLPMEKGGVVLTWPGAAEPGAARAPSPAPR